MSVIQRQTQAQCKIFKLAFKLQAEIFQMFQKNYIAFYNKERNVHAFKLISGVEEKFPSRCYFSAGIRV